MNDSVPPPEVRVLYDWLSGLGFSCVEVESDGPFNRLIICTEGDCKVRLLADRGDWSIALRFFQKEWTDPDVWEAYLDRFPLAGDLSDLDHQVQFLMSRLTDIRRIANPEVEDELYEIGAEYMRRQLGIGPPE